MYCFEEVHNFDILNFSIFYYDGILSQCNSLCDFACLDRVLVVAYFGLCSMTDTLAPIKSMRMVHQTES
jgi:hypothetical protein